MSPVGLGHMRPGRNNYLTPSIYITLQVLPQLITLRSLRKRISATYARSNAKEQLSSLNCRELIVLFYVLFLHENMETKFTIKLHIICKKLP